MNPAAKKGQIPLDTLLRRPTAAAITAYQRGLSPLKGYSRAHRVLHGGDSCSQQIKGLVLELGPLEALAPARERLGACRVANEALRAGVSGRWWYMGERRRRERRWRDCCDVPDVCEPDSFDCDSRDRGLDCSP